MNIKFYSASLFLISLILFGCKTERLATHVPVTLPDNYRDSDALKTDTNTIGSIPWREFFKDAMLQQLIDSAIRQNMDMQLAVKNIEASRLMLSQAKAANLPNLQLRVNATSTNPSNNSMNGLSLNQFLGTNHVEDYTAALSLSWEADIWGKIKNQKAAALASYLQTEEARKVVQTQLVSQVAQGYYQLLMLYQLQDIAKKNLRLSDSTLRIVQYQYEVGDISSLAVEQVAAQRLAAAALIPDFEQQVQIQENAISVLSGQLPHAIATTATLNTITLPEHLQVGIPATMLSRRPDVKSAELAIAAAQANQQAAKASMYPSLVISADAGVNAFKSSNWFNLPASLFGSVAGSITQPILQRKQLRTQYEVSRVEQEKSVIRFKQSVITAVGEVSDAMVSIRKLKEKEVIASDRTIRLRNAIGHADLLFETGMATYLEVITAQSNVLQSELELAQLKKAELAAIVDLYRALGGGWTAE
ncbi:efflux transporter outer membrane subunit [Sphingobacterium spiritivorum]|uniref:efflux transporter outer membrane subunit n=1 Tax=Sphingobacterium spiritivorum TaxID=258 RepID=UPI001918772C|nr:TolC family protein [Sphingobacterium spiritivorum]QQT25801.1 TolC family protein [Sphingobacterium spiritivorum]